MKLELIDTEIFILAVMTVLLAAIWLAAQTPSPVG